MGFHGLVAFCAPTGAVLVYSLLEEGNGEFLLAVDAMSTCSTEYSRGTPLISTTRVDGIHIWKFSGDMRHIKNIHSLSKFPCAATSISCPVVTRIIEGDVKTLKMF